MAGNTRQRLFRRRREDYTLARNVVFRIGGCVESRVKNVSCNPDHSQPVSTPTRSDAPSDRFFALEQTTRQRAAQNHRVLTGVEVAFPKTPPSYNRHPQ